MAKNKLKEHILKVAIDQAKLLGYQNVTRGEIAKAAGVATGTVTNYLGTMPNLRRAVMRTAINHGVVEVVAQGLALGDKHAKKAPEDVKQRAVEQMLKG